MQSERFTEVNLFRDNSCFPPKQLLESAEEFGANYPGPSRVTRAGGRNRSQKENTGILFSAFDLPPKTSEGKGHRVGIPFDFSLLAVNDVMDH